MSDLVVLKCAIFRDLFNKKLCGWFFSFSYGLNFKIIVLNINTNMGGTFFDKKFWIGINIKIISI